MPLRREGNPPKSKINATRRSRTFRSWQNEKTPAMAGVFQAMVARLTGLEPATPGVTGRYSNQLSYNRPLRIPSPECLGVLWPRACPVKRDQGPGGSFFASCYFGGKGMNSASSPGGNWKRPCFQSSPRQASFAASIRSFEEATKFHQI